jgi:hypothetical protein
MGEYHEQGLKLPKRFYVYRKGEDSYEIKDDFALFRMEIKANCVWDLHPYILARYYLTRMLNVLGKQVDTWHADSMLWLHKKTKWMDDYGELATWLLNLCYELIYGKHTTISTGHPRFYVEQYMEFSYLVIDNLTCLMFPL